MSFFAFKIPSCSEKSERPRIYAPSFAMLVWIFLVMSFIGLVLESIVSFFQDGVWKDRAGLLWGPFSPIYGLGAVILTCVLYPIREKSIGLVFLMSAVVGASFEWLAGYFFEQSFGIVAWSYEGQLGDIGGHTSLYIALVWGLLGTLWIKAGYPPFVQLLRRMSQRTLTILSGLIAAFFVVDAAFTIEAFNCWYERAAGMPPGNIIEQFFADYFGDDYMASRFETMSIWTDLARR